MADTSDRTAQAKTEAALRHYQERKRYTDWVAKMSPELRAYHDHEWGVPVHDDQKLFELLSLEIFQAGLNWELVLHKRAAFNNAFHHFDIQQVAAMHEQDVEALLKRADIIRNRMKIEATITNARAILKIQANYGSLNDYLWAFVDGKPLVNRPKSLTEIPTKSALSVKIAKDMKKHGFAFVGPVIVYNYLQGAGLIDDHIVLED
ncbi:3-methyladenine DNA glycosylase [Lacticaseibacillus chiayiensis]|uniref:3-methyladenine DNA glycosylase n=1 Tax=Lacticaseibacillus chiayiensis TaxID=2100821 RepID=A0A4Q1U5A9_9LACO|nr:DNA-3-methyladenine glycosylase I [Lacticaseibacillus chiayiensis]QVI34064.1 DNA-3-methyladenine glycosylase I [Lacticaseibacillus chiayiensis]RXT26752.1 3-methyladenine DNA glycosylase [Lacticaseibacillus chiayiensis]UYN55841.1 DNA-3-methyladenine glycosylase I [Lacticaseibacillus chiayiensis]